MVNEACKAVLSEAVVHPLQATAVHSIDTLAVNKKLPLLIISFTRQ